MIIPAIMNETTNNISTDMMAGIIELLLYLFSSKINVWNVQNISTVQDEKPENERERLDPDHW